MSTQRKCIFCHGSGMSKEHFWPEWISSYILKQHTDNHISEIQVSEGRDNILLNKQEKRPGNVITKKLRVVCKKCNNGWMSQLEETVKPIIIAMMENKKFTIPQDELAILSKWITMKVLIAEQSEDGTQVTPIFDLEKFYIHGEIPDYFKIFIGTHDSGHASGYLRHSVTFSNSQNGPVPPLMGMKRNTQTVSFILGALFVYVIAARLANFHIDKAFNLAAMHCIFPTKRDRLVWPFEERLSHAEMGRVAYSLDSFISKYDVKHRDPIPDDWK